MRSSRGIGCALLVPGVVACRLSAPPATEGVDAAPPIEASRWEPQCRVADPTVLSECVREEQYARSLRTIVGARPPGSPHWQRVQHECDATLSALGFEVELHEYGTGYNVIGVLPGQRFPEQRVMLGAHYDHIPGCDGADDNASGVAGVLEAARVLSGAPHPRTLQVACWDEEERGLLGSRAWAAQARARGDEIVVYFNFDAIGYADPRPNTQRIPTGFSLLFPDQVRMLQEREHRADFIAVVADVLAEPWAAALSVAAERRGLPHAVLVVPELLQRSRVAIDLQRSDHASMWSAGYPAIMITDTAEFRSESYHCRGRPDSLASLDLGFATDVVRATTYAAALALQGPTAASP